MAELLAEVYRGKLMESRHYGDLVVMDKEGQLVASVGDSDSITFWRSAAKPLQVLPVVFSGAVEKYGITEKELAIMAASHNGEEEHTRVVKGILTKIGLDESALLCGAHPPYHKPTAKLIYQRGEEPSRLHNNCSGKHAALLTICKYYGWSITDYNKPEHPVQQLVLDVIAEVSQYPKEKIFLGIDGCGVVVFGLPLKNMAYAYARLANLDTLPNHYRDAAQIINRSMCKYPEMIAGNGSFNTDLLRTTGDKLIAKFGAEGVFCIGVNGGVGIALKIADGNSRAIPPVIVEALTQLDFLTDKELVELKGYHYPKVLNTLNVEVGNINPVFKFRFLHN